MALAATENANVCTSVRIRYFTVESAKLGRRRGRGDAGGVSAGETIGLEVVPTAVTHPIKAVENADLIQKPR